ncbi:MAG: rod shape-determining protein RodA [Candidatus Buchananbacteria bacterium]|jgi:rod shape determining protein RodA
MNLKFLRHVDWLLLLSIIFLALFGLAAIYSVALGRGMNEFGNFQKQLMWLIIGVPIMIAVSYIDYRLWRAVGWIGYGISIILLILVLTPLGSVVNGARGWFDFGFMSFQPVELTKIFAIIVLSDICSRYSRTIYKMRQLLFMGAVVLLPILLVGVQPDFGSAMVLFFIWLVAFLLIVKNKWHVILVAGLILATLAVVWFGILQPYQKDRVYSFLDPSRDPQGRGYNVRQSIIAVGAGKLLGRGLGFGSQSQLKFIPESQTDFIFSVIAEEIGFIGVAMVLMLYGFMFFRFYGVAVNAPDDFGMFIALLTAGMIFFHVFINVGMCIGLLPVTGISLPLISYGGSFLLTILTMIGINMSVYRYGVAIRGK